MGASHASPFLDERFLLLESLGHGGMGSVFSAFDRVDRRLVAVKVLRDTAPAGPSHPLATEFEAWSRVRHPNVVRAYEMGRAKGGPIPPGTPYLVLEHVAGRPAHQALRPGAVDPPVVEDFARQVLRALDHVHGEGLVHRDVKPGNVLVIPGRRGHGRIKLTDFGLVARAGDRSEPGRLSGSLPYASPEALLGAPIDGRADLYALGILLHYLSTGRLPFRGKTPESVVRWHLNGEMEQAAIEGRLPARLSRFVLRLMSRDRGDRPASAADALLSLGERRSRAAAPPPIAGRSSRAALRLALDAARLGGRRVLRVPGRESDDAALVREARVAAQVHGIPVLTLAAPRSDRASSLGRLVLRLLLSRGEEARGLVERFGLARSLPFELLRDLPIWDRARESAIGVPGAGDARGVAGFLLDSAARSPLVLVVERGAAADTLAREVIRLVESAVDTDRTGLPRAGGLLLLLHDSP
jgi:hypothetical protein